MKHRYSSTLIAYTVTDNKILTQRVYTVYPLRGEYTTYCVVLQYKIRYCITTIFTTYSILLL